MIYRAEPDFITELMRIPESGMGYQVIDAHRNGNGTSERFIVYNSELVIDFDENVFESRRKLIESGYFEVLKRSETIRLSQPVLIERGIYSKVKRTGNGREPVKGRYDGGKAAVESQKEYATDLETFVRFTAFDKDNRVDIVKNCFIPGTFSTTLLDYLDCKLFFDNPADRYVLPMEKKTYMAFHVTSFHHDHIQRGVVQPGFLHNGGGVEIFFEHGTIPTNFILKIPF